MAKKTDPQTVKLPVIEERVRLEKRKVETGKVKVSKHVRERDEVVDLPVTKDEVEIQRVPVNRVIDQPASIRQEGDTTIIPIMAEELIVQKRLVLKEEVRITKRHTEVKTSQTVTLRSEEVDIQREELQQPGDPDRKDLP